MDIKRGKPAIRKRSSSLTETEFWKSEGYHWQKGDYEGWYKLTFNLNFVQLCKEKCKKD